MQDNIIEEIKHLIHKYVISIDKADIHLASDIWMDSSKTSFIHPKGHEHGFEEIKQNFYIKTMNDNFSERKLSIHELAVQIHGGTAIAEFYWNFKGKLRSDGSALETSGRETQVYCKDDQALWKLVHVHYSNIPIDGEREGF